MTWQIVIKRNFEITWQQYIINFFDQTQPILRACKDLDIDPEKSVMIGDKPRDIECGINAGVKGTILFENENLYDAIKNFLDK